MTTTLTAVRRRTRARICLAAVLLVSHLLPAGHAAAQTLWTDGTGNWFNPINWSAGLPASAVDAQINNGGTAQLATGDAQAHSLILGRDTGQSGNLEVFGFGGVPGTLAVGDLFFVGDFGGGTMKISALGSVSDRLAAIGLLPGAAGAVTVSGTTASWSNSTSLGFGNGSLTISNGGKVSDVTGTVGGATGQTTTTSVTGAGSTWTNTGNLFFSGNSTSDVLTIADGGLVTAGGQAYIGAGGTINIGSGGAAGTLQTGAVANSGTLHFNHTGAVTFSADITGAGSIVKDGSGTTTITTVAGYTGAFTANAGQLILKSALGPAAYSADPGGTLRFDAATVNLGLSAIRANATTNGTGAVEYNNSTVNGGFLRGPGTHTLLAGGTNTFNGVTTFNSTAVVQNGPATFTNFTNGGSLASNATATFDGVTNTSSGTITINGTLNTQDFTTNGALTVNGGGVINHSTGNLVAGGGSRTVVNAGGTVNLKPGTALELDGALLVNNGTINGPLNVNYGSVVTGTGNYGNVAVTQGGRITFGDDPGVMKAATAVFGAGGGYVFQVKDARGAPGTGSDFLDIAGRLDVAGAAADSPFTITLLSLDPSNRPGPVSDFDSSLHYALKLATAGGGISGFTPDAFAVQSGAFANDLAGGRFSVAESGDDLLLVFTPAPGTAAALAGSLLVLCSGRRWHDSSRPQ